MPAVDSGPDGRRGTFHSAGGTRPGECHDRALPGHLRTMSASEDLAQLAADYWEGVLQRDPTLATFYGDYRYNDRLQDIGPLGRMAEEADLRSVLARLEPLRAASLGTEDRITWD